MTPFCPSCGGTVGGERFQERAEVFVFPGHRARYHWCPACRLTFQFPQLEVAALPPEQQACETTSQNPLGTGRLASFIGPLYYRFTRGWFFAEALERFSGRSWHERSHSKLSAPGSFGPEPSRPARLLDVGAGIGLFCSIAGSWFDCVGLEPSLDACRAGRRDLGATGLVCGSIDRNLFKERFEIVTFWQTIEHISGSPRQALEWAADRLVPGGILFLGEIPDLESFEFALFKGECKFLSSPLHNFLFTAGYFERTLRQAGFREVVVRHDWRNYSLFSQSLLGWFEHRLGRPLPGPFKLVLSILMLPFILVFNFFLARKGRSATFSVLAIR